METSLTEFFEMNLNAYKKFTGITSLPKFEIATFEPSLENFEKQGYCSAATHEYTCSSGKHTISVWSDLHKHPHADHLLFHEFTHMHDIATHVFRDSMRNIVITGYTEYHAGQIGFLKLLNATSIFEPISFSLDQCIETLFERMTVLAYMKSRHDTVKEIIGKPGFPGSFETLIAALGAAFSYLGKLSICRMYARDYDSYKSLLEDTSMEDTLFGWHFVALKKELTNFLSPSAITFAMGQYRRIVDELIAKYRLL